MKIKFNKKILSAITAFSLGLTLTSCKENSNSSQQTDSSTIYIDEISDFYCIPANKDSVPNNFYQVYSYGDVSIKDLYFEMISNDEIPQSLVYWQRTLEDSEVVKNFIHNYRDFVDACEKQDEKRGNEILQNLMSSELFTLDFYKNYFPILKDNQISITESGNIELYDGEKKYTLTAMCEDGNISKNIFSLLKKYYTMDKTDEKQWLEIFSNIMPALEINPNSYISSYDNNDNIEIFTVDNLLDANESILSEIKDVYYDKYLVDPVACNIKIILNNSGYEVREYSNLDDKEFTILEKVSDNTLNIEEIYLMKDIWYYVSIDRLINNNDYNDAFTLYSEYKDIKAIEEKSNYKILNKKNKVEK